MRLREVVCHHVDLDAGFTFADVDGDVALAFLEDAVAAAAGTTRRPRRCRPHRRGRRRSIGDGAADRVGVARRRARAGSPAGQTRGFDGARSRPCPSEAERRPPAPATDTYTGEVSPGGPADVRELPRLTIRKASVSAMDNNAYLLTCRATGAQLLVDAAADAGPPARPADGGHRAARRRRHDPPAPGPRRCPAGVVAATGARTAAGARRRRRAARAGGRAGRRTATRSASAT